MVSSPGNSTRVANDATRSAALTPPGRIGVRKPGEGSKRHHGRARMLMRIHGSYTHRFIHGGPTGEGRNYAEASRPAPGCLGRRPCGIRWSPALGRLTSKNPTGPLPFPSTIPGRLRRRLGLEGPHGGDGQPDGLQACEQDRASKQLEAPCEILISDDAIIPLGRAYREAVDLTQGSQVWRVTSPEGTLYLVGSIHALKPPRSSPYLRFTNRPTRRRSSRPGREPAFDD